jgi:hypothetical protein
MSTATLYNYEWSRLNPLQLGRFADLYFKMQFGLHGFGVYSAKVDERRNRFVLRGARDGLWEVQVRGVRDYNYPFVTKSSFRIRQNLLLALAVFFEGQEPYIFLVPSTQWNETRVPLCCSGLRREEE